jgi:dienelactone hydrolase
MSAPELLAYTHAETALTGYLARPEGAARAAIVIFPTIANVNDHMHRRARMLADAGYLAMIADFYGEPVTSFAAAGSLADKLRADPAFYRARLAAAIRALRTHPYAQGLPMAAIGYCMGGGAAIEAARDGQDLLAAVSFHGLLGTALPAQRGAVKARLLVLQGDADPMVPREHVLAFQDEMNRAGVNWHFHSYSGVRHGFTDPASDGRDLDAVAYNASADRQSWAAMLGFLDEVLAGEQS